MPLFHSTSPFAPSEYLPSGSCLCFNPLVVDVSFSQSRGCLSTVDTKTSLLDFVEALLPRKDLQSHMVVERGDDDDPASVKFHEFEPLLATVLHAILPSLKRLAEQVQSEGKKGAAFVGLAAAVAEAVDGRLQAALEA